MNALRGKGVVRFAPSIRHDYRRLGALLGVALSALLAIVLVVTLVATRAPSQFATLAVFATASSALLAALGYVAGARFEEIARIALTDSATVLANRHAFDAELAVAVSRARTTAMPLALLVLDVDRLKTINDEHGHRAGDRALCAVATAIKRACRARDLVARWGGDEFTVLMTRTTAGEARVAAERIHAALAAADKARPEGAPSVSVSIGVADLATAAAPDGASLFEAADEALRVAKAARPKEGRARVVVAQRLTKSGVALRGLGGAALPGVAGEADEAPSPRRGRAQPG